MRPKQAFFHAFLVSGFFLSLCGTHAANGSFVLSTLASFNYTDGELPTGLTLNAQGNLYGTTYYGGTNNDGTVFKIAFQTGAISTLANFSGANGSGPYGGVTLDSQGNLYGTTSRGGNFGYGTVFEIKAGAGTLSTLATFNSYFSSTGTNPEGPLTIDAQGNIYGTTVVGGANGYGTVFKISAGTGTFSTIAELNTATGGQSISGLTFDSQGNLYGTTSAFGPGGDGTVFKIAAGTGILSTIATFGASNGSGVSGLTIDPQGNLYGTVDYGTGNSSAGAVFKISTITDNLSILANLDSNSYNPVAGVTLDTHGDIFGTISSGGTGGAGSVFEIAANTGMLTTIASFNGINGSEPFGNLVIDAQGNIYGTTGLGGAYGYGTVFELSPSVVPEPGSLLIIMQGVVLLGIGLIIRSRRLRRVP